MFARIHTLAATPEQYEKGLEIVREDLLPYARETTGFCGLIGLVDKQNTKALVITLWADEAAFEASAARGDRLSLLAADASGAERQSLEEFEVGLFEILSRESALSGDSRS